MATHTERFTYDSGLAIYAKAQPLDFGTYANGIVSFTEQGTSGSYVGTVDSDTAYQLRIQADTEGGPAPSDEAIGDIEIDEIRRVRRTSAAVAAGAAVRSTIANGQAANITDTVPA